MYAIRSYYENKTDDLTEHPITLNGAPSVEVTYTLVYWLVDACGNRSENDYTITIVVTPRPDIIKMNDPAFVGP